MSLRTIDISGMHCAACVSSVEKALNSVPGVGSAHVNLVTNRAVVEIEGVVVDEVLARAITAAGFRAEAIYEQRATDDAPSMLLRIDAPAREYRKAVLLASPFALAVMSIAMWAMFSGHYSWVNPTLFVLTLPVLWAGRSFYRGAIQATLHRTATMDTLVSMGTGAAFVASLVATFAPSLLPSMAHHSGAYYDSAATIITLVLLGKWLEARAKGKTADALQSLMQLHPSVARVRRNGADENVPANEVVSGETIVVRAGERIATDGVIISGNSSIDESLLTGESIPREHVEGDSVIGGSVNITGAIIVRATAVGANTVLAGIIRSVERAQSSKAPIQRLADRISRVFVPIVIVIAVITAVVWITLSPAEVAFSNALTSAIAVLIIACPCALGLATPTAIIVGSGKAARKGILFTNAGALELLQGVDTVVLDKTGTLTQGTPYVRESIVGSSLDEIVALARHSLHPVSKAISLVATSGNILEATSILETPGTGIAGLVNGRRIRIGNHEHMTSSMLIVSRELLEASARYAENGWSIVYASVNGKVESAFGIADVLRESSIDAVARMRKRGLRVIMITGDKEAPAKAIAAEAGIIEVIHSVSPEGKAKAVASLQSLGAVVAMVGDGINDAPGLAQSNVGIAMGDGTDVARSTADITLMRHDLHAVVDAMDMSGATMRTIRQNLFFAFAYNTLGIPLAAGLLIPFTGMALSPMIAAAAMALSSVTVITNSLRLQIRR